MMQCVSRPTAATATARATSLRRSPTARVGLRLQQQAGVTPLRATARRAGGAKASASRAARPVRVCAADEGAEKQQGFQLKTSEKVAISAAVLTAVIGGGAYIYGMEEIQDLLYGDGLGGYGGASFGNVTGSLLWSVSLYYASPLQLLLLFLGRIDTDRPSDGVLRVFGQGAGLDVDSVDFAYPPAVKAAVAGVFLLCGCSVAALLQWAFGEATWSVSTGLGSCIAAAVYELGRPARLSVEEAQALEAQWQDFAVWADTRLDRTGRCHETEISSAFRTEPGNGRYRTQDGISDSKIRNMIANWAPNASRTSSGYYKGVSVKARVDPFVGGSS